MKHTESGKTYWNNEGAYQELYDTRNVSDTRATKLLDALKALNYEYFNNGNCNVTVEEYHGFSKTLTIEDHYKEKLEYIQNQVEDAYDAVEFVIEIMLDGIRNDPHPYNDLTDHVLYYISTH